MQEEIITYNHLNLPTKIIFNNDLNTRIEYLYDAGGRKVQKKVFQYDPPPSIRTPKTNITDYLDGFQYKDGELKFFTHAEGYVNNTVLNGNKVYNYVFNYTDHLGNVRVSYGVNSKNVLKILEENHYYPFGLKHTNYNSETQNYAKTTTGGVELKAVVTSAPIEFKYKYNGKEWQDELGLNMYDYGFRNYMPDIGRWFNVDPLSEKYYETSPYTYVANNAMNIIDPDGRYLFGLFGSNASERRVARAEKFAAKVGGSVVMRENGRPAVNYNVQGTADGGMSFTTTSKFGDFSSWKNVGQTLKGFDAALEGNGGNEYTGAKGMRDFGEDASTASTYVKGAGALVAAGSVVTGQLEFAPVGMAIFEAGDVMDKTGAALLIGSDLNDGNLNNAAIRIGAEVIDAKVGKVIDASSLNGVQKFGGKAATDGILDKSKEQLIEP